MNSDNNNNNNKCRLSLTISYFLRAQSVWRWIMGRTAGVRFLLGAKYFSAFQHVVTGLPTLL
jgi:hypothetical protein